MKRALVSLAILACLGFTGSRSDAAPPELITGLVFNASTGLPVSQAVVVVDNSLNPTDAAQTNDEGRFLLRVQAMSRPIQLKVVHGCFHEVRRQLSGQALDGLRQVDLGLPPDNEVYGRNAPPLGGCETR